MSDFNSFDEENCGGVSMSYQLDKLADIDNTKSRLCRKCHHIAELCSCEEFDKTNPTNTVLPA